MNGHNDFQRRVGVGEAQHAFGRHVGTTRTTPVRNELTGKVGGAQTEHWSGRVDATVRPDVVRVQRSTS